MAVLQYSAKTVTFFGLKGAPMKDETVFQVLCLTHSLVEIISLIVFFKDHCSAHKCVT